MESELSIGQRVSVSGESGVVRYVGATEFAPGEWVGIELDTALGKNNGVINGRQYFVLEKQSDNYGIFVRPGMVQLLEDVEEILDGSSFENIEEDVLHQHLQKDNERLQQIVLVLQQKVKKMHDEIADLKMELELKGKEKLALEEQLLASDQLLERNLVDKEIVEEKLTSLQRQLTDIQLLQSKHSDSGELPKETMKELELQLEVKYTEKINQLETHLVTLQNVEKQLLEVQAKLDESEIVIVDLRDQLDTVLDSDNVVDNLKKENSELLIKVKESQETVEQLEQLQLLNDEVLNDHMELEKDLKSEIDNLQRKLAENQTILEILILEKQELEDKFTSRELQSSHIDTVTLTSLESKCSVLEFELEMEKLENNELGKYVTQMKETLSDGPTSEVVEYLNLQFRLNVLLQKVRVISEFIMKSSDDITDILDLFTRFNLINSCQEINCFVTFILNVMTFNSPISNTDLSNLVSHMETLISTLQNCCKTADEDILGKTLKELNTELQNYCSNSTIWATDYYITREKFRCDVCSMLKCFTEPSLWFIGKVLDQLHVREDDDFKRDIIALKKYYSLISQFNTILQSQVTGLDNFAKEGHDIESPLQVKSHKELESLSTLVDLLTHKENAEVFVKEECAKLDRIVKQYNEISLTMVKLDQEVLPIKSILSESKEDHPTEETENLIALLRDEISRMSKILKEKEDLLEEQSLRISVLNRKIDDGALQTEEINTHIQKVKELEQKNEELILELHEAAKRNETNLQTINALERKAARIVGTDGDLQEELKRVEKSYLIQEIYSLRNTLSHHVKPSNKPLIEDWLFQDTPTVLPNNKFADVKLAYKKLMSVTDEFSIIPVSSIRHSQLISRYYTSVLQSKYDDYDKMKTQACS